MKKFASLSIFCLISLALSGCCGKCQDDDDLRTTPITNNPHIVPNTASVLPGMPSSPSPGTR